MNVNDNQIKEILLDQDSVTISSLSSLMDHVRKGPATEALEKLILKTKRRKMNATQISHKNKQHQQQQGFIDLNTMYNAIISGDKTEEIFPEICCDIFDDDDDDNIPNVSFDFDNTINNNNNLSMQLQKTYYYMQSSDKTENVSSFDPLQQKPQGCYDKKLKTNHSTNNLLSFFKPTTCKNEKRSSSRRYHNNIDTVYAASSAEDRG